MLKLGPRVRVLDLDGSIADGQPDLVAFLGRACYTVAARDLGPHTRYMGTRARIRQLFARLPPDERACLTLYGSGDFHHVTAELLRAFPPSEPLSVVVLDRHPDWDFRSPVPCCGSWVLDALRLPYVRRVVVLGLGRDDINGWRVNVGSPRKLRGGRVALYPYDCPPSYDFGGGSGTPAQPAPIFTRGPLPFTQTIGWQTLQNHTNPADWAAFLDQVFDDLPTQNVYLSIDKDCLAPAFAVTNWEPGHLALSLVEEAIARLADRRDIIGADITGEYSFPEITSPLFRYLAQSDRPASAPGHPGSQVPEPTGETLARNEATNQRLLRAFGF